MIGVLDSGVGGLSILREIRARLPNHPLMYVADQANLPYGPRPLSEVQQFSEGITRFLLEAGVSVVVVACNTASAAALHHLREVFPQMPFVGMEPAVRPATRDTRSGKIGVIATAATFQGRLYASLLERFAQDVEVITRACPELVLLAERGTPWTESDFRLTAELLAELRAARVDQLVLGCTHFTFVTPLLQAAMGDDVTIVDPAPAVARQVERVLNGAVEPPGADTAYFTTGDTDIFQRQVWQLLDVPNPEVQSLQWVDGSLNKSMRE
jgi:glutamate racemase